jgi:hypothetical protein
MHTKGLFYVADSARYEHDNAPFFLIPIFTFLNLGWHQVVLRRRRQSRKAVRSKYGAECSNSAARCAHQMLSFSRRTTRNSRHRKLGQNIKGNECTVVMTIDKLMFIVLGHENTKSSCICHLARTVLHYGLC